MTLTIGLWFLSIVFLFFVFFFQAEDGIRDRDVTGVQTCALPILLEASRNGSPRRFYFDTVTGLLLRTEEWNAAGKITEAFEYQDYRDVDGVKVQIGRASCRERV